MSGPGRRFDPAEVQGGSDPDATAAERADLLATARILEAHAAADLVRPTEGFEDRVMAAIAREPAPRVVVRSGSAVRGGLAGSFLVAVGDAWALATRGGRPLAVRAQALAFLLLVVVAAGSLGGATVVGVGSFLASQQGPSPSIQAPVASPTPAPPSAIPSESPSPSPSPSQSPSPSPTVTAPPTQTAEPTDPAEPTDTAEPTETAGPDETHDDEETRSPDETPDGSDDHGGESGSG